MKKMVLVPSGRPGIPCAKRQMSLPYALCHVSRSGPRSNRVYPSRAPVASLVTAHATGACDRRLYRGWLVLLAKITSSRSVSSSSGGITCRVPFGVGTWYVIGGVAYGLRRTSSELGRVWSFTLGDDTSFELGRVVFLVTLGRGTSSELGRVSWI